MKWTFLLAGFVGAGTALAEPTTRPTTRPVDVSALVAQLGAAEFRAREAAGAELLKMGPAAIPALQEAMKNPDPEVQTRAGALVREIEQSARKKLRPRPPGLGNAGSSRSTSTMTSTINGRTTTRKTETVVFHGRKEVTVTEDGRNVQIVEDGEGIQMLVTDGVGGQETVKAYEAKTADELLQKEPEAFALYQQYTQRGREQILRGPRRRLGEAPVLPE